MKTLYSHLNEGILDNIDDQVKGLDAETMIRNFFAEYVFNNQYSEKMETERLDGLVIDTKNHTIDVSKCCRRCLNVIVKKGSNPFPGFPSGYTLIGGPELHEYHFFGNIDSIRGIPTNDPKLVLFFANEYQEPNSISKQVEKELGDINKAKKIYIETDNQKIDLSNLKCRMSTLELTGVNTTYTFNENMRTELLSLDRRCTPTNLPTFGTLTWSADYDKIVKDIQSMTSTGKSNFDKIKIQNKELTTDQKEQIRSLLKGEKINTEGTVDPKVIYDELNSILKSTNEGWPLKTGDIVVCNGFLDVFVRQAGSRYRTMRWQQATSGEVVKINIPELVKLMDKYKLLEK